MEHTLKLAAAGLLAVLTAGCASQSLGIGSGGCRAVGRMVWTTAAEGLDATAVVHYAPPTSLFLRVVDPLGRVGGELRTDGQRVRIVVHERRVYWEGEGAEAIQALTGFWLSPQDWVELLRGTGTAPPGWSVDGGGRGCLADLKLERLDGGARLALSWDAVEPWPEAQVELGPPPAGFDRVSEPPARLLPGAWM